MKTRRTSKLLALVLALALVVTLLPTVALADGESGEEKVTYVKGFRTGPGFKKDGYIFVSDRDGVYYASTAQEITYKWKDSSASGVDNAQGIQGVELSTTPYRNTQNTEDLLDIPVSLGVQGFTMEKVEYPLPGGGSHEAFAIKSGDNVLKALTYDINRNGALTDLHTEVYLGTSPQDKTDQPHYYDPMTAFFPVNTSGQYGPYTSHYYKCVAYSPYIAQEVAIDGASETTYTFFMKVVLAKQDGTEGRVPVFTFFTNDSTAADEMIAEWSDHPADIYSQVCTHSKELIAHPGTAATDGADGVIDYWECPDCGACFRTSTPSDEDQIEWSGSGPNIPKAHWLVEHPVKTATCTETGVAKMYWECKNCGECYSSNTVFSYATLIYNIGEYTTPATGHSDANGDLECDVCRAKLTPIKFRKVTDKADILAGGTYILVDEEGNVMGRPAEPDEEYNYPTTIPAVTVTPNGDKYDYYACKAAGAMIFELRNIFDFQNWGSDVSMVYGMHYNGLSLTCYGGRFAEENAQYAKYGQNFNIDAETKQVSIGSFYDVSWDTETNGYFRSNGKDAKAESYVFSMLKDGKTITEENDTGVYLYRAVEYRTGANDSTIEIADAAADTTYTYNAATVGNEYAPQGTSVTGLTDAWTDDAKTDYVNELTTDSTVEVYATVTVTDYQDSTGEGDGSVTFQITPCVSVDCSEQAPQQIPNGDLDGEVTVVLYTGGIEPGQIVHFTEDGPEYYYNVNDTEHTGDGTFTYETSTYQAEGEGEGDKGEKGGAEIETLGFVTFTTTSFSSFVLNETAVEETGGSGEDDKVEVLTAPEYDAEAETSTVELNVGASVDLEDAQKVLVARYEEGAMKEVTVGTLNTTDKTLTVEGKDLRDGTWRVFLLTNDCAPICNRLDVHDVHEE